MSYEIASPLSMRVLQLRQQRGELQVQHGDSLQQLFNVPSLVVNRRRFIADVDEGTDAAQPHPPIRLDVPEFDVMLGHYRAPRQK